jgi:hypothetical protein
LGRRMRVKSPRGRDKVELLSPDSEPARRTSPGGGRACDRWSAQQHGLSDCTARHCEDQKHMIAASIAGVDRRNPPFHRRCRAKGTPVLLLTSTYSWNPACGGGCVPPLGLSKLETPQHSRWPVAALPAHPQAWTIHLEQVSRKRRSCLRSRSTLWPCPNVLRPVP